MKFKLPLDDREDIEFYSHQLQFLAMQKSQQTKQENIVKNKMWSEIMKYLPKEVCISNKYLFYDVNKRQLPTPKEAGLKAIVD